MKTRLQQDVLDELNNTKFPTCKSRKNIGESEMFVLGQVNYRGQKFVQGRTKGPSRFNKKFPILYRLIRKLIREEVPDFKYTTIQVNKNVVSPPHVDKNNVGPSYIIGLGDYSGGKLVITGKSYNIKHKWKSFDGRKGHWVETFRGDRYSLVFFTHTFKPPNAKLRYIKVTKKGLYDKGILVQRYKSRY